MDSPASNPAIQQSGQAAKQRRRLRADPAQPAKRVAVCLKVSPGTHERLAIHALKEHRGNVSALVEALAARHLTRYRLSDFGPGPDAAGPGEITQDGSPGR